MEAAISLLVSGGTVAAVKAVSRLRISLSRMVCRLARTQTRNEGSRSSMPSSSRSSSRCVLRSSGWTRAPFASCRMLSMSTATCSTSMPIESRPAAKPSNPASSSTERNSLTTCRSEARAFSSSDRLHSNPTRRSRLSCLVSDNARYPRTAAALRVRSSIGRPSKRIARRPTSDMERRGVPSGALANSLKVVTFVMSRMAKALSPPAFRSSYIRGMPAA